VRQGHSRILRPSLISSFSEIYSPYQSENAFGCQQSDTPHYPANLRLFDEISDAPPEKRSCKCSQGDENGIGVYRLAQGKKAMYHNNCRVLFEEGAVEPLMQFLTRRPICLQSITWLKSLTHIPIETLRSWRKGLLKDPSHRPYSQPANLSKCALTKTEEQAVADRF
jgi:hypothetical protein